MPPNLGLMTPRHPPTAEQPARSEQVAVIGAGYVGLTTAACLAHLGHQVVAVDVDAAKVRAAEPG